MTETTKTFTEKTTESTPLVQAKKALYNAVETLAEQWSTIADDYNEAVNKVDSDLLDKDESAYTVALFHLANEAESFGEALNKARGLVTSDLMKCGELSPAEMGGNLGGTLELLLQAMAEMD